MKFMPVGVEESDGGRTPHGVRGLKFICVEPSIDEIASHPSRGAWIEIAPSICLGILRFVAPLTGCVD